MVNNLFYLSISVETAFTDWTVTSRLMNKSH